MEAAVVAPDTKWFSVLTWSQPLAVETFRRGQVNRMLPPESAGVYVFTLFDDTLSVDKKLGVIYIGESGNLRSRIKSYMVDPEELNVLGRGGKVSTSLKHAGKVGLLVQIQQRSRGAAASGIFLRWTLAAEKNAALALEVKMINLFTPGLNNR